MTRKGWRNSYQYQRLMEVLSTYWLDEPDESRVEINLRFEKNNGEIQIKRIVWVNPDTRTTTFKDWAIARYIKSNTVRGDFVRDMSYDPDWPEVENGMQVYLDHLYKRGACAEAIRTFKALYNQYARVVQDKDREAKSYAQTEHRP